MDLETFMRPSRTWGIFTAGWPETLADADPVHRDGVIGSSQFH